MINYLPLHEDFVENLTVFKCLSYLYEIGNQYMVLLAEPVIKASLVTLSDRRKYCDDGTLITNYKIFLFSIIIDWYFKIIALSPIVLNINFYFSNRKFD